MPKATFQKRGLLQGLHRKIQEQEPRLGKKSYPVRAIKYLTYICIIICINGLINFLSVIHWVSSSRATSASMRSNEKFIETEFKKSTSSHRRSALDLGKTRIVQIPKVFFEPYSSQWNSKPL